MSVYQVEEYYIYMSIKDVDLPELNSYLNSNGLDDFSIDGDSITIDGIECENVAAHHEEEINELRNSNND